MSSRTYNDPEIGQVRLVKSARARRISVRVHPLRGVTVTVPRFCSYAAGLQVFGQYRGWVLKTLEKQKSLRETASASAVAPEQIEAMRQEAKMLLPRRLSELAERYGFSYGRVFIKHNSSNWGSCSARGNINLNLNLVRLPQLLRDHVILHELCHLRHSGAAGRGQSPASRRGGGAGRGIPPAAGYDQTQPCRIPGPVRSSAGVEKVPACLTPRLLRAEIFAILAQKSNNGLI